MKNLCYDLNADRLEFFFRLRHDMLPHPLEVIVAMKPYGNRQMIEMLKEKAGHLQQAKDDIDAWDVKEGKPTAAREFFDKQFIELRAKTGKQYVVVSEAQLEKLDARYGIREITIEQGYNGITRYVPEITDPDQEIDLDAMLDNAEIRMNFALIGPEGIEQNIVIPQLFTPPAAMDSLQWDRAQIQQGLRGGGFRVNYNHEALTTLYNKLIRSCFAGDTGIVMGETPCEESNKEEWLDKVPYLFKRAALQYLFSRAERTARGNG